MCGGFSSHEIHSSTHIVEHFAHLKIFSRVISIEWDTIWHAWDTIWHAWDKKGIRKHTILYILIYIIYLFYSSFPFLTTEYIQILYYLQTFKKLHIWRELQEGCIRETKYLCFNTLSLFEVPVSDPKFKMRCCCAELCVRYARYLARARLSRWR